ncbi:MAG: protein translocase SEC61 complex subunit gamma [Thaumarchaeota archaeon]|nr:protein translocase SEC61 complex subunit gamma [Nitrososphaerota archaeon]
MQFLNSCINTLKYARKSDRKEYFLYLKLTLAGLVILGSIGYVVQLVGSIFRLTGGPA